MDGGIAGRPEDDAFSLACSRFSCADSTKLKDFLTSEGDAFDCQRVTAS